MIEVPNRHLMNSTASSTPVSFNGAVVDDTQHLWLALDARTWVWADIAGYLERLDGPAGPATAPRQGIRQGETVHLGADIALPLHLLSLPRGVALEQGIHVRAVRRSSTSWYRPLHIIGAVQGTHPLDTADQLAATLGVPATDLAVAADAHIVPLATFRRRLADLCTLTAATRPDTTGWFHTRWFLTDHHDTPVTPWQAVMRGQIGLVEQLWTARHWNKSATSSDTSS